MPSRAKARHVAAVIAANGGGVEISPEQIEADRKARAKSERELRAMIEVANRALGPMP